MKISRKHNATKQAAKDTVSGLMPGLMSRFGESVSDPTVTWRDHTVEFSGRVLIFNIKGSLQITDTELIFDVEGIPFFKLNEARASLEQWFDQHWPAQSKG